ncbi:MAG: hopanoid-associated sugar epimerase [Candidatus Eutrophobiaceae bacterium]
MKVLLTGGNGFVGSAVLRRLRSEGHKVRVLIRPGSNLRNLQNQHIELVSGDLAKPETLAPAVQGCNALFHVAADYRLWVPNPDQMYRINVEGSRSLMKAALAAGVERIVYTSSVAVLGSHKDGSPANEETSVLLSNMIGHYKRSKYLAEEAVQELIESKNLPAVIVNPSTPIGPRDVKPTPTGRIILDTLRERMPAYVDTGLNVAHVDDVAHGHMLAWQKGEIGQRYILGGENMSLREILECICQRLCRKSPAIRLPHAAVLPVAWCMERIAAITGNPPRATVDEVRMSQKKMYFSSAKAEQALGYTHRPAKEGIADAVEWFQKNGYV